MTKATKQASRKAAVIRGLAHLQGVDLADVAKKSGVHKSVFYRVIRGERASQKVDRLLARELGVKVKVLREAK